MVTGYEVRMYDDIRRIRIALESIAATGESLATLIELVEARELAKVPDPEQEKGGVPHADTGAGASDDADVP